MEYKLQLPEIESPFPIMNKFIRKFSKEDKELAYRYWNEGYIILKLDDIDIEGIKAQIGEHIDSGNAISQSSVYQYNDSPRVFEAWKWCKPVLDLARHPKILEVIKMLYGRDPIPFQTINFKKGSDQPLHSDVIHFHTVPERWVVGAWAALEDMDEDNGTLQIVPGSHKWPVYDFQDLGLEKSVFIDLDQPLDVGALEPIQNTIDRLKKFKEEKDKQHEENYRIYEQFIRDLTEGCYKKKLVCPAGSVLLWQANLVHGGTPTRDKSRTRWSQATHYYFNGCEKYYSPMYSNKRAGVYAEKDLSKKDILNHVIR